MVLPAIIAPHREVTFVVKESLVRHPLFGHVMRSRDPIVVGRTDPRKDLETVMNKGPELISKGSSIIIFPQSTRSLVFKPEDFNSLGVKLARKTGVKVIPVALKTDFWGQGKLIKELGPLTAKSLSVSGLGNHFLLRGMEKKRIRGSLISSNHHWISGNGGYFNFIKIISVKFTFIIFLYKFGGKVNKTLIKFTLVFCISGLRKIKI